MLERVKSLLAHWGDTADSPGDDRRAVELAAAVLMVEAATMDIRIQDRERDCILRLLRQHLGLDEADARTLLAEAEQAQAQATQLLPYTRSLKDALNSAQRIEIIEMLWQVAYADGHLHDYEASLVRRVSGLLFVPDQESGAARKRALDRLGLSD